MKCTTSCRLAGLFGVDVEPDVVELGAAAPAHVLDVAGTELLRELLQMRAEAHGPQEAGRVRRRHWIGLEPRLDLGEAGSLQPLRGLLRAREVPRALPAGEMARVRLLRADLAGGGVEALDVALAAALRHQQAARAERRVQAGEQRVVIGDP